MSEERGERRPRPRGGRRPRRKVCSFCVDKIAEKMLHAVYIYTAAVGGELVHHIQGNYHRDIHFYELHG